MKKLVSIVLLFTFCCAFVSIPREARADGVAQGALIGAGIGLVIGIIFAVVSPKKENSQKTTEKTDETIKVAENFRFIPENQSHKLASSLKVNNGQAILYSW